MNRVSTATGYSVILANLTQTQLRQIEAAKQVSSQKQADDLKGYARKAETLTAMKSVQSRINGLLEQNTILADRFTTQDVALTQLAGTAEGVQEALSNAIASGRGETTMQEIRGFFANAIQALNTKSQGRYLFAGGQIDAQPVSATSMDQLTAGPALSTFFHNDRYVARSQLDETSSIDGGMLADDLGTALFQAFKDIQAFEETTGIDDELTDAQKTFLQSQVAVFDNLHKTLIATAARNGAIQNRIDAAKADLSKRQETIEGMVEGVVGVNMAEAISRLEQAQFAVQASAQVFQTLQSSTLLNWLKL